MTYSIKRIVGNLAIVWISVQLIFFGYQSNTFSVSYGENLIEKSANEFQNSNKNEQIDAIGTTSIEFNVDSKTGSTNETQSISTNTILRNTILNEIENENSVYFVDSLRLDLKEQEKYIEYLNFTKNDNVYLPNCGRLWLYKHFNLILSITNIENEFIPSLNQQIPSKLDFNKYKLKYFNQISNDNISLNIDNFTFSDYISNRKWMIDTKLRMNKYDSKLDLYYITKSIEIGNINPAIKRCNASKVQLYVEILGNEILGGIAYPRLYSEKYPCNWYFPFNITISGKYIVNVRLLYWNGQSEFNNDKCYNIENIGWRSLHNHNNNNSNKLNNVFNDVSVSLRIDSRSKFYDRAYSCCEWCTRMGPYICKYWMSGDKLNSKTHMHVGQRCIMFYDENYFDYLIQMDKKRYIYISDIS